MSEFRRVVERLLRPDAHTWIGKLFYGEQRKSCPPGTCVPISPLPELQRQLPDRIGFSAPVRHARRDEIDMRLDGLDLVHEKF